MPREHRIAGRVAKRRRCRFHNAGVVVGQAEIHSAPKAAIRRSCSRIAAFFQSGSRCQNPRPVGGRPAARGALLLGCATWRFVEDALGSPRKTSEETPFAANFQASLPMTSPRSLLRWGHSNHPCVPPVLLQFLARPFLRLSLPRADRRNGGRAGRRRDRIVALGRILQGGLIIVAIGIPNKTRTCDLRHGRLSLESTPTLVR